MSNPTPQDLFIWADKFRQAAESRTRSQADVTMLEEALAKIDPTIAGGHNSSSQLEFAKSELERTNAQYDIAFESIKTIVAALDKAK